MGTEEKKEELKHSLSMFNKYKDLLMELTRKNVKLKYRNSWLGIFWSFLQEKKTESCAIRYICSPVD